MNTSRTRPIIAVLFASGALSLAYQMVWTTLMLDELGVSAYSHAAVLATFMAGLALGSAWLGRAADRTRAPLRLLAALELGVGAYAFVSPALFEGLRAASTAWIPTTAGPASLLARTAVAACLLLPPTLLMGGTWPAALRHVAKTASLVGRDASRLYAANAAGAVLGGLVTAFVLLPRLGIQDALNALGVANLVVAAVAFVLGLRADAAVPPESGGDASPPAGRLPVEALLAAAAGLVSFCLEVVWIRFFSLVLASSVYSFALIVAAFITGIALGSGLLGSRRVPFEAPLAVFAWTQAALGLLLILVLPLHPYLAPAFAAYLELFSGNADAFYVYEAGKLLFCFVVVLLPATLIGMTVPLMVQHVSRALSRVGGDAGRVYAWSTWGNVTGALAAGLVLLPALGMERVVRLCALVTGLVALAAAWRGAPSGWRGRYGVAACVAMTALTNATIPAWNPALLTLTPFRRGALGGRSLDEALRGREVLLFRDDAAAHLAVLRRPGSDGEVTALVVNGKPDASSAADMPTQLLAGHLPLLLHHDPRRVLIVGLASGSTAGAVLTHPVERVDSVELVRSMPEAARYFSRWNGDPLSDPRHRLVVEDARRYVEATSERYDVIVSEPPNPWVAGVGNLFTERFYRAAQARLNPRGIFMQWIQAYEMSDETFAVAVRTLAEGFPWVYAFQGSSTDVLLLGVQQPLAPAWLDVEARLARGAVSRQLASIDVRDIGGLLALQRFSPATIDAIAARATHTNTMDNRFLEQRGPREVFQGLRPEGLLVLDERLQAAPSLLWSEYMHSREGVVLRPLRDERLQIAPLEGARLTALVHLDESILRTPGAESVFPAMLLAEPPLAPAALAERILELTRERRHGVAVLLLERYRSALLTEAALDRGLAGFWLERSREWLSESTEPTFRRFRIELLMATRRLSEATQELESWLNEGRGPDRTWARRQSCLIDRNGAQCERLRDEPEPDLSRSP